MMRFLRLSLQAGRARRTVSTREAEKGGEGAPRRVAAQLEHLSGEVLEDRREED